MMKKLLIILLILVLLGGAGAWFGMQYVNRNYVRFGGEYYRRDVESLNLDGRPLEEREKLLLFMNLRKLDLLGTKTSVEDYEWIRSNLPDCEIRWELPFQGEYLSLDTESIQVDHLSEADAALLDYLPNLKMVDAWDCRDYDVLLELEQRRPECTVQYYVQLGGSTWSQDWETLELVDADLEELTEKLPLLPSVKKLHFSGNLPPYEALQNVMKDYPGIEVTWDVSFRGQGYSTGENYLNMDGVQLRYEEAKELFYYLPELEEVDMHGCSLTEEECKALCQDFPEVFFRFDMTVFNETYSTDAEEIDISGNVLSDAADAEKLLVYFKRLRKLVMCDCGIENEAMEEMNRRHEDVQFVWRITLGKQFFRTDITTFMPVKYGMKVEDEDIENLKYCHNMICIDLGHMNVHTIEWAREMPDLRFALFADTKVRDVSPLENHLKLVYLELFQTNVKDTLPLVSCTALEDLNLCYTSADVEPIAQMTWLKRLWWSGRWRAQSMLPEALPDTHLEFNSGSSTGKGWRNGKLYYEQRDLLGMGYMEG